MKTYVGWILTIVWAMLIWQLTTTTQITVSENTVFQNILMIASHFSFFGIQAVFFSFALTKSYLLHPHFLPIALTSLYGAIIEYRQLSVVGRTADPMDWVLDTLGALTFLLALKKLQSKV